MQIANTLVSPTGTGYVFDGYQMNSEKAVFKQNTAGANPALLTFSRTVPQGTANDRQVLRGGLKYEEYATDANGVVRPLILSVATSLPTFRTKAEREAFVQRAVLAVQHAVSMAVLNDGAVPQAPV